MAEVDAPGWCPCMKPQKANLAPVAHRDPYKVAIYELEADTKSASLVLLDV